MKYQITLHIEDLSPYVRDIQVPCNGNLLREFCEHGVEATPTPEQVELLLGGRGVDREPTGAAR